MDTANSAAPSAVPVTAALPSAVTPWPRSAQLAMAFLLCIALTLLAIQYRHGLRWSSRPTNLERGALAVHHIDLNRAGRVELLQVPGIGESLAQRIEDDRRQHGPYPTFEALTRVSGIGPTILERLRPWLSVQQAGIDLRAESHSQKVQRQPGEDKSRSKKEKLLRGPIDINLATVAQLQRLPGVGPRRAQLIIEERKKRPFLSIDELRRVSGIGPKILERLRPYVTVESGPLRIVTTGKP